MHCDRFLELIEAYLRDELDGDARTAFREHLESCASCREQALELEPTLLFVTLPRRDAGTQQVDECVAGVQALIRQDRLERRLRPRLKSWMAAAALVVVGLGGGLLLRMNGSSEPKAPEGEPGHAVTAGNEISGTEPPSVEVDMKSGVRIYQYAQDEDDNTAVYFIVNSSLES